MDVLLIQPSKLFPSVETSGRKKVMPPMQLFWLANPLREKGFDVHILDRAVTPLDGKAFKNYIAQHRPQVVGITCFTVTYNRALQAAAYVKDVAPSIKVVLGGPHVTFTAPETLNNSQVDVVVRGEGDCNFPLLVEHYVRGKLPLEKIPGISYRNNGKIHENPTEIIEDIEALSFPTRDKFYMSHYSGAAPLSTSRGCPYKCRFCCATAIAGGKYRMRSIESIEAEIDYLLDDLGFRSLNFLDDTLTAFPKRTEAICRYILKKGYPVRWFCESRADAINKELLDLMIKAGCDSIQLGLESGSQEILSAMDKKVTSQQVESAGLACLEAGLRTIGNFIIGFPEDTPKTVQETVNLAKKLSSKGAVIGFGGLTPLPGTYYYDHAEELGLHIRATNWDEYEIGVPIADTPHFTCEQLREIVFDTTTEARWACGAGNL